MKDYTNIIIHNLEILYNNELLKNNYYKARAYKNVIENLLDNYKPILTFNDFLQIKGVGDSISGKIKELFETNKIQKVEDINNNELYKFKKSLLNIYGIGPKKINELLNKYNINSIDDLKKNKDLLNSKQYIGLKYYNDLQKRIDLTEYKKHYDIIIDVLNKYNDIIYDFVGSYRRKLKTIGDIDLLIKENKNFNLNDFIDYLKEKKYIIETLALGKYKFMGLCIVNKIVRRIDILIAPEIEYPYSLLYFTGSYKFNIGIRKIAKKMNYSLSEHGLKSKTKISPKLKTEKEIFDFLQIKYLEPKKRNDFNNIEFI